MTQVLSIVETWIQPFTIALLLTYGYSQIERSRDLGRLKSPLLGVMFGLAAVYSMTSPMVLADGVFIDLRTVFIGVAAGLFGALVGAIALGMAIAMRIYLGGAGVLLGIGGIIIVYGLALLWRRLWPMDRFHPVVASAALGVSNSLTMVMGLFLPPTVRSAFFVDVAPTLLVCSVFGTVVMCFLLQTERSRAKRHSQLEVAATTDPLTNLLNRRSARLAVEKMPTPADTGMGRAMMTFDIDHFKRINDENGHAVGDAVLQAVTARVKSCLRPGDVFSRIGGDEFLVVLPQISVDGAERVSERCRLSVAEGPVVVDGTTVSCTISMGTDWRSAPPNFSDHLAAADRALYRAKEAGRNRVTVSLVKDGGSRFHAA